MNPTLAALLLDLTGLSDEEAEDKIYQEYVRLYMDRKTRSGMIGELKTHDGESVTFYEDRFDHAFFTSVDRVLRPHNKGKFDKMRGERVRWIGRVIQGEIRGTSCWYFPPAPGGVAKRLYVLCDECYLIWLNAAKRGGWKFSSAYTANRSYIRRKIKGSYFVWRKE